MKISVINQWNNSDDKYTELRIGTGEACCIKETESGYTYVLECEDGNDVYSYVGGADYSLRKLTDDERAEIIKFVRECSKGRRYNV